MLFSLTWFTYMVDSIHSLFFNIPLKFFIIFQTISSVIVLISINKSNLYETVLDKQFLGVCCEPQQTETYPGHTAAQPGETS